MSVCQFIREDLRSFRDHRDRSKIRPRSRGSHRSLSPVARDVAHGFGNPRYRGPRAQLQVVRHKVCEADQGREAAEIS